jgi:hypothetical protein
MGRHIQCFDLSRRHCNHITVVVLTFVIRGRYVNRAKREQLFCGAGYRCTAATPAGAAAPADATPPVHACTTAADGVVALTVARSIVFCAFDRARTAVACAAVTAVSMLRVSSASDEREAVAFVTATSV